jgi:hypothetical protein
MENLAISLSCLNDTTGKLGDKYNEIQNILNQE